MNFISCPILLLSKSEYISVIERLKDINPEYKQNIFINIKIMRGGMLMRKNGVILYQSKYGATKKYAEWIVEATGFDCIRTKEADINKVAKYDTIILAGGIYASGIAGISFLKKNIFALKNKKIAVFCVGASPYNEGAFSQVCEHNFKGELQGIPCYYGRGMWNEEKMSFVDRTLCKMLQKAVAKQDPATFEPWQKALMDSIGETSDWTDKEYLKSLLDWVEQQCNT